MIETTTVNGRPAQVAYIGEAGEGTVEPDQATLIKVVFTDAAGGIVFLNGATKTSMTTSYLWAQAKRNALARLAPSQRAAIARAEAEQTLARLKGTWNEEDHPRDEDGKFTDSGGGGGGGSARPSTAQAEKPKPEQQELWPDKFPPIPEPKAKVDIAEFEKDDVELKVADTGLKMAQGGKAAKDFEKVWNDQVGSIDPGEFKEKFLGGVKGTMSIVHRYKEDEDGQPYVNDLNISGQLLNENGAVIGQYTREIDLANNKADSSYFKLYNKNTGGGVGKQLLAANVEMYRQLGLEKVEVHANIDVGGYAWARYGYVPTEDSWSDEVEPYVRERLDEMAGGGRPDEWDMMSSSQQDEAFRAWADETFDEFHDSEIESWRESGGPLDQTKIELAEKFTERTEFGITHWAWKAVQNARAGYPPGGEQPMTLTNDEILAATTITYESDGEGRNDPVVTVEEIEGLTEDQRYSVEQSLQTAFNYQAELNKDDIQPPEYLADQAREYQKDTWNDKRDSEKFEYAEQNDLLGEGEGSGEIDYSEAESIRELLDSGDPKAIWAIADSTHGKELLLGSDWQGAIDFSDRETMNRFNAYVGKK